MEASHFQFRYILKPSALDILIEKIREIDVFDESEEDEYKELLNNTMIYFLGIKLNFELVKSLDVLPAPVSDQENLFKKLFCIESPIPVPGEKPIILEIWDIMKKKYKKYYSTIKDENPNVISKLSFNIKDQIGLITCLVFRIVRCCMTEITMHSEEENDHFEVFLEDYRATIHQIYEEGLSMFDDYAFDSNYLSVDLIGNVFSIFQESGSFAVIHELEIPTRLIKKFERLVEWCYTPEFEEFFKQVPNPEFCYKIVKMICQLFGNVFVSFDEGILPKARKDYVAHLSAFKHIDMIWNNYISEVKPINETAKKALEEIVRYYIALHLYSQILAFQDTENEEIIFYNVEKLKQIWKLILNYSNYQKLISEEFNTTYQIIENFNDREDNILSFSQVLDCEVLCALFTKCILNLDIEYDPTDFETVKECLYSLASSLDWEIFVSQLAISLQQRFEAILDEAEVLEFLYIQADPAFVRSYYITEYRVAEFTKRLLCLVRLMRIYEFSALANDTGMKSVMSEYLAKFFNSPVFHLIDIGNAGTLASNDFFYSLSFVNMFFTAVIPNFITKYPEVISAINQDLEHESEETELFRKKLLVFYKPGQHISQYFEDTYFEDPRKIHSVGSKLFEFIFFNIVSLRTIKDLSDSSILIPQIITVLNERILENTHALVHMKYLIHKKFLSKEIDSRLASIDVIEDSDIQAWMSYPIVQSYNYQRAQLLVSLLQSPADEINTKEEMLLYKISVLDILQMQMKDVGFDPSCSFYMREDNLQKIAEAIMGTLVDFYKIVEEKGREKIAEDLIEWVGIFEIIQKIFEEQFFQWKKLMKNIGWSGLFGGGSVKTLSAEARKNFMEKLFKVLTPLLDKIEPKMIMLKFIYPAEGGHSFHITLIMKAIYSCYEYLVNNLAPENEGEANEDFEDEEKKPKKSKKGKGKKDKRGRSKPLPTKKYSDDIEEYEDDEDVEEKAPEEAKVEEKVEASTPLERQNGLRKLLSRILVFFDMEFDPPYLSAALRQELQDFLADCRKVLLEKTTENANMLQISKEIPLFSLNLYQNCLVNRFRIVSPLFLYVVGFRKNTEVNILLEHNYYLEYLTVLTKEIFSMLERMQISDFEKEEKSMLTNDFMPLFFNCLSALLIMAKHLMKICLISDICHEEFQQIFEFIFIALKKWGILQKAFGENVNEKFPAQIALSKELQEVLYYGINKIPDMFTRLANDKDVLGVLIKRQEAKFYVVGESYVLRAFETEKILELKLKSLVYLDKTGSRIFQNNFIKAFERYWDATLQKVWAENFHVEKVENSENKHSDRIVNVKENPG